MSYSPFSYIYALESPYTVFRIHYAKKKKKNYTFLIIVVVQCNKPHIFCQSRHPTTTPNREWIDGNNNITLPHIPFLITGKICLKSPPNTTIVYPKDLLPWKASKQNIFIIVWLIMSMDKVVAKFLLSLGNTNH